MKKVGIWLDMEKAHLVTLTDNEENFETIPSELEFFKPKGGSGTRSAKWGPQDVVQDSKYLERKKHQLKKYFGAIEEKIEDADALAFFGPAKTNRKLKKYLEKSNLELASKIMKVDKADSMTNNQVRALVRDYFMNAI